MRYPVDTFMNSNVPQHSPETRSWPKTLNRFFIGLLVLAICFFLISKLLQAYSGDKQDVSSRAANAEGSGAEKTLVLLSKDADALGKMQSFSELESYFGSKVVLVSATEPAYVLTDDEQRFEVGAVLETDAEISSISSSQLVLKEADEFLVFVLPDSKVS